MQQVEGFGSYGFLESHAASFALIAYASSWVKRHRPATFCCALLNSIPMGFYAPTQIVRDARDHGVPITPVCTNRSRWDCTLEQTRHGIAVRLDLCLVKGLSAHHGTAIVAQRIEHFYGSVEEVWHRSSVPASALERMAEADAFNALGLDRREALWAMKGLADSPLPLFAACSGNQMPASEVIEPLVFLTPMNEGREVVKYYGGTGLKLRQHPVAFLGVNFSPNR